MRCRSLAAVLACAAVALAGAPFAAAEDPPVAPLDTTTTTGPPTTTMPPPAPEPPPLTPEQLLAVWRAFLPQPPAGSGEGRRIVYAIRQQRVWLLDDAGQIVRTHLVSGRANLPRPGAYRVFSKSPTARSGAASMRWMVRFARGRRLAIGFHSIPTDRRGPLQTEAQLGTFRSQGCVRQRLSDAQFLYDWAPLGTPVFVTP